MEIERREAEERALRIKQEEEERRRLQEIAMLKKQKEEEERRRQEEAERRRKEQEELKKVGWALNPLCPPISTYKFSKLIFIHFHKE